MTIIFCAVFGHIFKVDTSQYAPFVLSGLACWSYIQVVTLQGCMCFFVGESYIRQHPAPMAVYPLRTALGAMIHFLLAMVVVLALTFWVKGPPNPLVLLSLVPTLVLLFLFGWSLAVLSGLVNVFFQDTKHIVEVGFQILFYATPIMYPVELLRENHLGWLLRLNPLVSILQLIREPLGALMANPSLPSPVAHVPALSTYAMASGTVLLCAAAATYLLGRLQRQLIFYM